MTYRKQAMKEARRLLSFLAFAGVPHDLTEVADALLEWKARGVEWLTDRTFEAAGPDSLNKTGRAQAKELRKQKGAL